MSNNKYHRTTLVIMILFVRTFPSILSYTTCSPFISSRVILSTGVAFYPSPLPCLSLSSLPSEEIETETPLCDLQTFLKLTDQVESGGQAKSLIQNNGVLLNGRIESRRAKKLYTGDTVALLSAAVVLDVSSEVKNKGYVYKVKTKKAKPVARIDEDGNKEFGGRFRSEDWRKERKAKKEERKVKNKRQGVDGGDGEEQ